MASIAPAGTSRWLLPGDLCAETSRFLSEVYSEEHGLYPFSTRVVDGRYENDFASPWAPRYTINTLLGRLRAADAGAKDAPPRDRIERELELFERRYRPALGAGDRGLFLVLLADAGAGTSELADAVHEARSALERHGAERLNLQDLSWLVWGLTRAEEVGVTNAAPIVHELYGSLRVLSRGGLLARHSRGRARGDVVSFGGTVYYLRALHEYGRVFDAPEALGAFVDGVRAAMRFQGPRGEWPWLVGASRGQALDAYPVYSVHQLAMAMLFLFPALDDDLVEGVEDAIARSYRWVFGENELGAEFARKDPFLVFRSLERDEPLPKLTRFIRAGVRSAFAGQAGEAAARRTRINREWRSYEAGWLLYAWSGREAISSV